MHNKHYNSRVHRSFGRLMSFKSLLTFTRAIYWKSDSGNKLIIPVIMLCGYQGTTTRRPHPNDLTMFSANSSARGLTKEGLPTNVLERTSPRLRYMKERLEP